MCVGPRESRAAQGGWRIFQLLGKSISKTIYGDKVGMKLFKESGGRAFTPFLAFTIGQRSGGKPSRILPDGLDLLHFRVLQSQILLTGLIGGSSDGLRALPVRFHQKSRLLVPCFVGFLGLRVLLTQSVQFLLICLGKYRGLLPQHHRAQSFPLVLSGQVFQIGPVLTGDAVEFLYSLTQRAGIGGLVSF